MCNINKKTRRKTVTVYKVVAKIGGNYYSTFAGTKIQIGKVKPQTIYDFKRISKNDRCGKHFLENNKFYNPNVVGKTTGFKDERWARVIAGDTKTIIKMVLSGEIWMGDSLSLSLNVPSSAVTFAGSEVLSYEVVWEPIKQENYEKNKI